MLNYKMPLNISDPHAYYLNEFINYNWKNLTEKLKQKIQNSNFIFQNETVKFEILDPTILESLTSQQFMDIFDNKSLVVHKMITNEANFFIERNFFNENIYEIYFEFMNHVDGVNVARACDYYMNKNENFEKFYRKFTSQDFKIQIQKINDIKHSEEFDKCLLSDFKISRKISPIYED